MAGVEKLVSAVAVAVLVITTPTLSTAQSPNEYDKQLVDAIKRRDKVRVRTLIRHPSIDKEGGYPAGTGSDPERAYEYWLSLAVTHTAPRDGIFELLLQNGSAIENPPTYMASCNALPLNRAAESERGWVNYLSKKDPKTLGPDPWLCTSPCKYLPSSGPPDISEPSWRFGAVFSLVNRPAEASNVDAYNATLAAALKHTPDLSKTFDNKTSPDCFGSYPLLLMAATSEVREMLVDRGAHLYGHPLDGSGWSIAHWSAGFAQSGRGKNVDMPIRILDSLRYLRDAVSPKDPLTGYSIVFVDALLARNRVGVTAEGLLQVSTFHGAPAPFTGWAKLPASTTQPSRNAMRKFLVDSYAFLRSRGHLVPDSQIRCLPPVRPGTVSECIVGVSWRSP